MRSQTAQESSVQNYENGVYKSIIIAFLNNKYTGIFHVPEKLST